MKKPILCLDFDGVIHSYVSGWQGECNIPDPHVAGFFEWLDPTSQAFDIKIFSSRCKNDEAESAMSMWLIRERAMWRKSGGQSPLPDLTPISFQFVREKPAAFVTIDDRALTFNGVWSDPRWSVESLLAFKPWNK